MGTEISFVVENWKTKLNFHNIIAVWRADEIVAHSSCSIVVNLGFNVDIFYDMLQKQQPLSLWEQASIKFIASMWSISKTDLKSKANSINR